MTAPRKNASPRASSLLKCALAIARSGHLKDLPRLARDPSPHKPHERRAHLLTAAKAGATLERSLGEPYPPERMARLAAAGVVPAVRCGQCFRFSPDVLQEIASRAGVTYSSRGGDA